MQADLVRSRYTTDLFLQYKKHLGTLRFAVLKEGQLLVVPKRVATLLGFRRFSFLLPLVPLYKLSKRLKLEGIIKTLLLPPAYKKEIYALDVAST